MNTEIPNLKDKVILITGGTGSFGKNFVSHLLANTKAKKIIVFSRDEFKQSQMNKELTNSRLRFFIGDVRDLKRLHRAFAGVDIVIHAAALKQVTTLEYNPFEAVKTNIVGSQNVIEAAIDQGVEKVILISTDKAVHPSNLYGSTKLCAEKLFISGNSYAGGKTRFSCVRYGNVIGSRGSVVDLLLNNKNILSITDERMTRFWITLEQSFGLVYFALQNMEGGEIFIPKIPSMKITDLFETISPKNPRKATGIRPGEKLHEILLTKDEATHARELLKYFVILPEFSFSSVDYSKYLKSGKALPKDFYLASDHNNTLLTKIQLREIIKNLKHDSL